LIGLVCTNYLFPTSQTCYPRIHPNPITQTESTASSDKTIKKTSAILLIYETQKYFFSNYLYLLCSGAEVVVKRSSHNTSVIGLVWKNIPTPRYLYFLKTDWEMRDHIFEIRQIKMRNLKFELSNG